MAKKCIAAFFYILLPLLIGYAGVMAGFPSVADSVREAVQALPVSSGTKVNVFAFVGPLGVFFAMMGTWFAFRSADVKDNHDGTIMLGVKNRVPRDDIRLRRILPGVFLMDYRGVRLVTLSPPKSICSGKPSS